MRHTICKERYSSWTWFDFSIGSRENNKIVYGAADSEKMIKVIKKLLSKIAKEL